VANVIIENPVLNSPFEEPRRHFRFDDDGITDEIVPSRRPSAYFVPIARPKKKGAQAEFDTIMTKERERENENINRIRARVAAWREGGYLGVTPTTSRLLQYWRNPERERKLFFCQIEALETAIYLTECARKFGDAWIDNQLREANDKSNPGLPRVAFKMATGSGKTVVMAMLIAWHTLNKIANPQDARFSDTFLVVTPGITIRDRLRVLLPNDPGNYYRERDIVPSHQFDLLAWATIHITNFHTFLPRELVQASKTTKEILRANGNEDALKETPEQTVRRACRALGNKKHIIVLNDEAHHCYRRRPETIAERLSREEKREADKRNEEARVWISGLEAVHQKIGLRAIYDLSATPSFLRGSGYEEGEIFPWVVSDFSLIDAIESGIVKVPRVPVADDSVVGEQPTYRELWSRIRNDLPKKGRGTEAVGGEPKPPKELEAALHSLYGHYEKAYREWEADTEAVERGTPPVFIVVCNNTNVSKLVFDYIAGWEKEVEGSEPVIVPGKLAIFNNELNGDWNPRPNTILVDSEQLESGDAMKPEFKKIASAEIEKFKEEIRERFPGRDVANLTDEDLLREVLNTVGKRGRLGEHVKCVVSVSMLTEGWDANTVTHILGVRAFGTQLLCEQVVGRALRRMRYAVNPATGLYDPEYADVYGVPFSFIPTRGAVKVVKPETMPTRVRALEERAACEIRFPRVIGYKQEFADERLPYAFTEDSRLTLSTEHVPTKVENAPIVGETAIHNLDELKARRPNEVAFLLAKLVLEQYFRGDDEKPAGRPGEHRWVSEVKAWRFPEVLAITRRWLNECVVLRDNTFPQLLLLLDYAYDAADKIYGSITQAAQREPFLKPIVQHYDPEGSTQYVDFDTRKPTYATRPDKCHLNHAVLDTLDWEQKLVQSLEDMPEITHYVKNFNLGFTIPYTIDGEQHPYYPDFIAHVDDGYGPDDRLNLIIEVTGERKKDKEIKVHTARTMWVPAINNHGGFGRWAFLEILDPWNARTVIRRFLGSRTS
jgi:type III restriction enzyme